MSIDRLAEEHYADNDPEFEEEDSETESVDNDLFYINSYIKKLKEKYPNEHIVVQLSNRINNIKDYIDSHED